MSKPMIGVVVGTVLGIIDGLSAWLSPEARTMMLPIIAGSTVKGLMTGLAAGLIARRSHSMAVGVISGIAIGGALSAIAAAGQDGHQFEIILPGMMLGALVGFATQRYPQNIRATTPLVIAVALLSIPTLAQQAPPADPLAAVAPFVGKWTGTSEGQPGSGTVERDYERILGSRFIRVRNRSTYPPQATNPKGERHEDEGVISFDRARKRLVFRQFHVEGFVNTYAQDLDAKLGTIVFVSEAIENIPPGYRARETYLLHGADDLEEVFEMAEPGKQFEVYSRTRLKRAR
jgi:hypothetical protein